MSGNILKGARNRTNKKADIPPALYTSRNSEEFETALQIERDEAKFLNAAPWKTQALTKGFLIYNRYLEKWTRISV